MNSEADNHNDGLNVVESVLGLFSTVPDLALKFNDMFKGDFALPNIPFKVIDADGMLWDTLVERNGWRFQQNEFTRHCRILDSEGIRRAWGTKNGMLKALKAFEGKADWQKE